MALDYSLDIQTDLLPEDALSVLANDLKLKWEDEEPPNLFASAIKIFARPTLARLQSTISEHFNFFSTLHLSFRLHPVESDIEYEEAKRIMLKSVLKVLERSTGDAVMLFNGETIVLQRFSGKLSLNKDWDNLFSDNKDLFSELDYEITDLPSPLL